MAKKVTSLISVIVPMHNEAANLKPLYSKLVECTKKISHDFEFIFVDDGSSDSSLLIAERLSRKDPRVRVVEFARNFGKEAATSAGLHAAKGDAAIMMDADLQHPPELIAEFVKKWAEGADVVVGIKRYSKKEGWFKRWSSARFY
ncbi:MAG TPA: glycosyltransferase family 2 protein, partial [Candidatus Saccharimonadales bacterium]|nr:glycosyltransferase family 2 protein [Candidatus Saccharimonadales bacterium]